MMVVFGERGVLSEGAPTMLVGLSTPLRLVTLEHTDWKACDK